MPLDTDRAIELLKTALLRQLGDEVDLIFRYGSLLQGTAHQYSDLDISYVPVHESTGTSITVLVDDVMIDLYPIRWSRLEEMADFRNISASVLLKSEIVYQRCEDAAQRFRSLGDRLRAMLEPAARPETVGQALDLFKQTGYPALLLRQQAAAGNFIACVFHAQQIVQMVFHGLALSNQRLVDTRKPAQVLALPRLPKDFAAKVDRFTQAMEPAAVATACEDLLFSTRAFLLTEQADALRHERTFPQVFGPGYPEFKGGLNHILLACERRDLFSLKDNLTSFYHELCIHMAWAIRGVEYSDFNSLADYEQNFVALGFPALLPYFVNQDFDELHRQCLIFDQHLQTFLSQRHVNLYSFADLDELQATLQSPIQEK